jgi:hypothetical protein
MEPKIIKILLIGDQQEVYYNEEYLLTILMESHNQSIIYLVQELLVIPLDHKIIQSKEVGLMLQLRLQFLVNS